MDSEIETLKKIIEKNIEENNKKIKEEDDFICNETYKYIVLSIQDPRTIISNQNLHNYVYSNSYSWFWQNKLLEKCPNIQKIKKLTNLNIKVKKFDYNDKPISFYFNNNIVLIRNAACFDVNE